jgi:hypothetical protein
MELLLKSHHMYTFCIHRKLFSLRTLVGFDSFLCTVQVQQVWWQSPVLQVKADGAGIPARSVSRAHDLELARHL